MMSGQSILRAAGETIASANEQAEPVPITYDFARDHSLGGHDLRRFPIRTSASLDCARYTERSLSVVTSFANVNLSLVYHLREETDRGTLRRTRPPGEEGDDVLESLPVRRAADRHGATFYLVSAAPLEFSLTDIFRSFLPFIAIQLAALSFLLIWPPLGLGLPLLTLKGGRPGPGLFQGALPCLP